MAEYLPVIDVTEEFFTLDTYGLNDYIRSLGAGAIVGVSFSVLESDSEQYNQLLLRRVKAFIEKSPQRIASVIATEQQVSIEPNVFSSGVMRIDPDF
jgi:hypothetical protein